MNVFWTMLRAAAALLALASLGPAVRAVADAPRLVVQTGHAALVTAVRWSPDGRLIATGGWDGTVRLWDAATGMELNTLPGHKGFVVALTFSPDGKTLASSANGEGVVHIWDVATGTESATIESYGFPVTALDFSPDGKRLAGATSKGLVDSVVAIWDIATGAEATTVAGLTSRIKAVAFSPDGSQVAVGEGFELSSQSSGAHKNLMGLAVCRISDGSITHKVTGMTGAPIALRWTRDGHILRIASDTNTLYEWTPASDTAIEKAAGPPGIVVCASFSADAGLTASVALDPAQLQAADTGGVEALARFSEHKLVVRDSRDGKAVLDLPTLANLGDTIAFSPSGSQLVVCGTTAAKVWDLVSRRTIADLSGGEDVHPVNSIAFSSDGAHLLGQSGDASLWNLTTAGPPTACGHGTHAVALRPDGKEDAQVYDTTIVLSDPVSGNANRTLTASHSTKPFHAAAYSRDGHLIAVGDDGGTITLWDAATGVERGALTGHVGAVSALVFSPNSAALATVGDDGTARLWNVVSLQPIRRYSGRMCAAFSPDGKTLATGARDLTLHFNDVETGQESGHFMIGELAASLAYATDASGLLVVGTYNGSVILWNSSQNQIARTLQTNGGGVVSALAFRPDGRFLAAGSFDGLTRLWDLQEPRDLSRAREVARLRGSGSTDWAVVTPAGMFDGTPDGLKPLHFVQNNRPAPLETFYERFFSPGLLPAAIAGRETAAQLALDLAQGPPPRVVIVSPTAGTASAGEAEVVIEATEQNGGGVRAIRLYQNGRLVGGPSGLRGIVVEADGGSASSATGSVITKRFRIPLLAGPNLLHAVAYSKSDIESLPAEVTVTYTSPTPPRPTLHVLAIGVNRYADASMNLTYARPDAEALADFFGKSTTVTNLFGSVRVDKLLDNAATGQAIREALMKLAADCKPEDVVLVYFAGHGETASRIDAARETTWYFLPCDARQMALSERVQQYGIPGETIGLLLAKLPARKIVMIYDACKSGAALAGLRGIDADLQALGVLARAQGLHVLAASTDQQYAAEVQALGHGILTYALLEGLSGKAANSSSGAVFVRELMGYVEARVPQLTRQYRGSEQYPTPFERGQDFPLTGKQQDVSVP